MRGYTNRSTMLACALGLASLLVNLLCLSLPIEPGALLIFVAALAFGIEGAIYGSLVGALPLAIISAEFLTAGRLSFLALVAGWWVSGGMRRPPTLAITAAWVALIAATVIGSYYSSDIHTLVHDPVFGWHALTLMINDLSCISLASVILITDFGWYSLVGRSRLPSLTNAMIHFITFGSLITLILCVSITYSYAGSAKEVPSLLWVVTSLAGVGPAIVIMSFRRFFPFYKDDSMRADLNPQRDRGFSGHSSIFWKRKELAELQNRSEPDSLLQIQSPAQNAFGPEYGVCILDGLGAITLANRRFMKLVGCADREPTGKPFVSLAMLPDLSRTFIDLTQHASELKRTREVRVAGNDKQSDRFFELSVLPGSLAPGSMQGEPGTVILTIREVTDRRAIEMSLLHAQKLASLGSVIAGIGHSFNSALTTIIGRASHARLVADRSKMVDGLTEIISEAQRAGTFVNKLLDFASDSSRTKCKLDLRDFFTDRIELFKNVLGTENTLELVKPERVLGVNCDPNLLTQAITNLLINARDSMAKHRPGRVSISLGLETIDPDVALLNASARPGTFVRIRISDNGEGMNSEILQHACEPSFTTRAASGHTGLGLPTAFAIARAHDGFLTIESVADRGTTISVHLPEEPLYHGIHQGDSLSDQSSKAAAQTRELSKPRVLPTASNGAAHPTRVLVLEDEPTVRELVAGMLEALGAEVVASDKPEEALALASKNAFDVAFVDLVMPAMGGNEWINKLRSQTTSAAAAVLPVVLMTGYGSLGDHDKSIHAILPKPFTLDELQAVLKSSSEAKVR